MDNFRRALERSTTLARTEIGEWVVHVDWTGNAGYPYSVYVWRGDAWAETAWAATPERALAYYARTVLLTVTEMRRSTAAAAALPQHQQGQTGMDPVGSMLGAKLPTWALSG